MPQQQKPTAVFSRVLQELRGQQRGQASGRGQGLGTHQVSTTATQADAAQDCGADTCVTPVSMACVVMKLPKCVCSALGA
jgi:hypothetical protein